MSSTVDFESPRDLRILRHPRARRLGRAPRLGPQVLRGLAAGRISRSGAGGARRAVVRLPVPEKLLRMTRFGLRHVGDERSGWWERVQREMAAFVFAHVPERARELRMRLDGKRMEVVVEYELARRVG
jgi:hypothetical protein